MEKLLILMFGFMGFMGFLMGFMGFLSPWYVISDFWWDF
jgi:hypothetical protein